MTIKEQIEIARSIASGTPREVAINEVAPTSSIEKSGQTIDVDAETVQDRAKSRLDKVRQVGRIVRKKAKRTSSAIVKSAAGKLAQINKNKPKPKPKPQSAQPDPESKDNGIRDINPVSYSRGGGLTQVTPDQGDATALQSQIGNLTKVGVRGIKNVVKTGMKGRNLYKRMRGAKLRNEEFIQEVEKKEKSGTKKVIDIMRGKNSIKVNPDMKEDTVVVQDASGKDFVEVVDIVSPSKVRSDWRKEINVTEASAAWTRKAGKNKSGGLNEKGRKSYERENPGSDLKAPSKKVGNPRRKSFCARMRGMKKKLTSKKTARDPNSRINKSLRAWNC